MKFLQGQVQVDNLAATTLGEPIPAGIYRRGRVVRSAPWTVKRPYFDAEAKDDIRYRHVHMRQAHQVIQVPTCCGSVKRVGSRFRPEKRLTILHGLLNKSDATRAVYKQPRSAARSGSKKPYPSFSETVEHSRRPPNEGSAKEEEAG